MKMMVVSTSCFNPVNREYYRRVRRKGVDVLLVVPSKWNFGKGVLATPARLPDDPELLMLEPTSFNPRLLWLKGLISHIKKFNPEILYLEFDPGSWLSTRLGWFTKNRGMKLISLSCENLPQDPWAAFRREGFKGFLLGCVKYMLIRLSMPNTDHLLVINDDGSRIFRSMGFRSVIKTPLGFNEQIFYPNDKGRERIRQKLNLGSKTVIAYFGRMVYEKGIHVVLKALSGLKHLDWMFMMDHFDGYSTDYGKEITAQIHGLGLQERVVFIQADHIEVADYMNSADIVVLASVPTSKWIEQYGRVVPEAMACGRVVVVSDSGAPKELVGDMGFVFPSYDISALTNLLEQLITKNKTVPQPAQIVKHASKLSLDRQLEILEREILHDQ